MKESFNEVIAQNIQLEIAIFNENEEEIYLDTINFPLQEILSYVHNGRIDIRRLLQKLDVPILDELTEKNFEELYIYLRLYDAEGNFLGIELEHNWISDYKQFISNSFDELFEEAAGNLFYEKYGNTFNKEIERL